MSTVKPFSPIYGATKSITTSGTSANVALDESFTHGGTIVLGNPTSVVIYFCLGNGDTTEATDADMFILPGYTISVLAGSHHNYCAAISPDGDGELLIGCGDGF